MMCIAYLLDIHGYVMCSEKGRAPGHRCIPFQESYEYEVARQELKLKQPFKMNQPS
jgi:hypothetical protein